MKAQLNPLIDRLWQPDDGQQPRLNVYVLVDAARSDALYPEIMKEKPADGVCLLRGKLADELAWVSPYLVRVWPEDPFLQWLLETGFGKSQFLFIRTMAAFNELKRHLQTLLTVYDGDGNSFFFRFYDPRVLRAYLPTCTVSELKTVFGPIETFLLESADPGKGLELSFSGAALTVAPILLA